MRSSSFKALQLHLERVLDVERLLHVVSTKAGDWARLSGLSPASKGSERLAVPVEAATPLRVSARELEHPVLVQATREGLPLGSLTLRNEASDLLLVPPGLVELTAQSIEYDDLDWFHARPKGAVLSKSVTAVAGEEVEVLFP